MAPLLLAAAVAALTTRGGPVPCPLTAQGDCSCPAQTYGVVMQPVVPLPSWMPPSYSCEPCPRWADTRGLQGKYNQSSCFCEDSTYNAAAQGHLECRDLGVVTAAASRPLLGVAREGLTVFWVPSGPDDAVAFETLEPLRWPSVAARIESGEWAAYSMVEVWWFGVLDDLERWDAGAAETARSLGSDWVPLQLVFPLLQAWLAHPVVCAKCDGGITACVDCCSSRAPALNCTDKLGVATPRAGWWRVNASRPLLHRCPLGPRACLGGPTTPCAPGYDGPLCAACDDAHAVDPEEGCVPCPAEGAAMFSVVLRGGLLLVFTLVMVRLTLTAQPPPTPPPSELEEEEGGRDVVLRYQGVSEQVEGSDFASSARTELMLVSTRTVVGWVQIQTLLLSLALPWPTAYAGPARFFGSITAAANVAAPLQCLITSVANATSISGDTAGAPAAAPAAAGAGGGGGDDTLAQEAAAQAELDALGWPYRQAMVGYLWVLLSGLVLPCLICGTECFVRWLCLGGSAEGSGGAAVAGGSDADERRRRWQLHKMRLARDRSVCFR